MKVKKAIISLSVVIFTAISLLNGCNSAKKIDSSYANYKFETQCLGHDGEYQTLRVWGKGNNKAEALELAKKNALRDVIFKGITAGNGGCKTRPLLSVANAEEKYEKYFNAFFSKGGAWNKYVKIDEKRGSRKVSKNSEIENWETTVEVNVTELENRLIEDNVLHK